MEYRTPVGSLDELMELIRPHYSEADLGIIKEAGLCAQELHEGQTRASGEPYIIHPLQVAQILFQMKLDGITLAAALLHDTLEDTILSREELRKRFGKDVENLVFGVTKIDMANSKSKTAAEAETIRKMLFAMITDIRVILIKLADKLHNMSTLQYKSVDKQRSTAQDTLDIFAPLAARLGISWLKDELEDLSLKFLHPEVYQQIKDYVSQKKGERSVYLNRVARTIEEAAQKEGLTVHVESRAKHFYSIYQKMKERNKKLEEIYDFLGIRILCEEMHDCYILLGLVHRLWMPIDGRFKDYIAVPKTNRYQSLHTTVMCFDGKLIEIQIRTHTMDRTAQNGVAAHWLYKQQSTNQGPMDTSSLAIISKLKAMNSGDLTSGEFLDEIKREVLRDSIYVFTPKGDVIQLPQGSTAIDFAYHIHTDVGHHAAAAKADGAIIPLKQPLTNTQVIEIITSPQARPNVDWLRCVKTSRTRHKIRAWLNHHDENLVIERNIVVRNKPKDEARNLRRSKAEQKLPAPEQPVDLSSKRVPVKVGDDSNHLIKFANCCNPVVGDDIIGYVSRGRGIIVHRRDCRNIGGLSDFINRATEVEWETISPRISHAVRIGAHKSAVLFGEIEQVIKRNKGHLEAGRLEDTAPGEVEGKFIFNLPRRQDYQKVLRDLERIRSVQTVLDLGEG